MKETQIMFPKARIPYGTWGSSYFPAWQSSPLSEVNIGQFAGEGFNRILGLRKVPASELDYLITGSTIPWHWKFWNSPLVASCMGHRIPGFHVEQACATGLQALVLGAAEVESGSHEAVGILTFDRTSDSPVGVFPERRAHQRTIPISDVWDNFGFDPATGKAMMTSAGNAARKYKLEKKEVDELAFCRYQEYFNARRNGFLQRFCITFEILSSQGKSLGSIDEDSGIRELTLPSLYSMREMDTCVTSGTQTHASDGMAALLVTSENKFRELSPRPEITIRFVAKSECRTQPSLMPEAPTFAIQSLLERTGCALHDISVLKTHNAFAINDLIFSKLMNFDWKQMNHNGCSLVWGHPQAPTLTRLVIEGLEETVDRGGGFLLVSGCAAGDVGIAALFKVE